MKNKTSLIKILLFLLIIFVVFLFLKQTDLLHYFRHKKIGVNEIKSYLLSYGQWSVGILLLIYTIKPIFVVTPISVLAVASGLVYGPLYGTIYTMIGAFLSATVGFYIAKYLGEGPVSKLLKGKKFQIEGDIEKNGFSIILMLRLAFIFPYDPLSYAAGLSKMKYRDFIAGTLIGVLPEMIAYNYLGTSIEDLFTKKSITAIFIIIGFVIVSLFIRHKIKKQKCNI